MAHPTVLHIQRVPMISNVALSNQMPGFFVLKEPSVLAASEKRNFATGYQRKSEKMYFQFMYLELQQLFGGYCSVRCQLTVRKARKLSVLGKYFETKLQNEKIRK